MDTLKLSERDVMNFQYNGWDIEHHHNSRSSTSRPLPDDEEIEKRLGDTHDLMKCVVETPNRAVLTWILSKKKQS